MGMKKDFEEFKRQGTAPLIMRTNFDAFECRIIYEIKEIGDSKVKLVTSYPVTRETADRILAGEIDPDSENPELWRPGRILNLVDYAVVTSIEVILK